MDPTTIALATSAVRLVIPYLKNIGNAATKMLGEKLCESLYSRLAEHSEAKASLDELRKNPDSDSARSTAEAKLRDAFDADPDLTKSVSGLLGDVQIDIRTGDDANVVGQNFGTANFSRHERSK